MSPPKRDGKTPGREAGGLFVFGASGAVGWRLGVDLPLELRSVWMRSRRTLLMLRKINWESQIGRRLKLRDLHAFSTVVQRGSRAKAARELDVFPPPPFPR